MIRRPQRFAFALALLMSAGSTSLAADDPSKAGAYCPFPEPGQQPVCLAPVQERYPAFLEAADRGEIDEAVTAAVEADLIATRESEDAYLALSSLAYAYYRLAQQEAADPGADPALVRRLEHWNRLLSGVYDEADPQLRGAVYEAAADLHARAPSVGSECAPGQESCDTTSGLMLALRGADEMAETQAVRGALSRLLGRMLGREEAQ